MGRAMARSRAVSSCQRTPSGTSRSAGRLPPWLAETLQVLDGVGEVGGAGAGADLEDLAVALPGGIDEVALPLFEERRAAVLAALGDRGPDLSLPGAGDAEVVAP